MKHDDPMGKLEKRMQSKDLRHELAKEARINIRVSEADKASMTAMAKRLGMTVTEYLTRLHHIAVEKLDDE